MENLTLVNGNKQEYNIELPRIVILGAGNAGGQVTTPGRHNWRVI